MENRVKSIVVFFFFGVYAFELITVERRYMYNRSEFSNRLHLPISD